MKNKLVIISGARRGIGKTFFDHYQKDPLVKQAIGISRSGEKDFLNLDLYDANETLKAVKEINLSGINNIFYMHAIGIDKFEPFGLAHNDTDGDGIDDDVYASNVTAFTNFAEPFIDRIRKEKIPTTICNIGSVSDIYNVLFWRSFTKSKNKVRSFVKSIHENHITGVMLNVSSTLDENYEVYGRTLADTTYWQTSKELLNKSLGLLTNLQLMQSKYVEADYYKPNPQFRSDYFTNLPKLYKQWQKDLGFEGKEIPPGIRI